MKIYKLLIIAFLISNINLEYKSQDSLTFHKEFYQTQQKSLLLLSSWSVGNLALSPFLGNNFKVFRNNFVGDVSSNDYFHQMNFNWNLLNAGIVGMSHFLVYKDQRKPWNIQELSLKKKKAEKSIIINMGLDVAYIISGLLIKQSDKNLPINQGYGNSLILQGGYLLIYDAIFLKRLKKLSKKYNY